MEFNVPVDNLMQIRNYMTLIKDISSEIDIIIENKVNDEYVVDLSCKLLDVDEIMTEVISRPFILKDENEECKICHETYNNQYVCKLDCGHKYHQSCIENWIRYTYQRDNCYCPLCRSIIN